MLVDPLIRRCSTSTVPDSRPGGRRSIESSAAAAVLPVIALIPVWLIALAVFWLIVRLFWHVHFAVFAALYLAAGVVLFLKPVQQFILAPLLGARRPTAEQRTRLETAWRSVLQVNHIPSHRYVLAVLPSNELNAYACGGHLVIVTTYAIDTLPRDELCGVLAHELSHHLGLHTVALTIGHWLSLPILVLAKVGFFLRNVAVAATRSFAHESKALTAIGHLVSALLFAVSWVFLAGLMASTAVGSWVGKRSEFQADDRVVTMGMGQELAKALRRAADSAGTDLGEGATTSHPPARTRVARIEAALRLRRRHQRPRPSPFF